MPNFFFQASKTVTILLATKPQIIRHFPRANRSVSNLYVQTFFILHFLLFSLTVGCSHGGIWNPNPDFEWDLKSGSTTIWNPDEMATILAKTIQNPHNIVQISNGPMKKPMKTWPFEIWSSKYLHFEWFDFRSPLCTCSPAPIWEGEIRSQLTSDFN